MSEPVPADYPIPSPVLGGDPLPPPTADEIADWRRTQLALQLTNAANEARGPQWWMSGNPYPDNWKPQARR
ncbi:MULTISPECIES: hypothetical protein [Nocardia]|uniref:hypothetical protein n=1 Tax=Nocardia TaxID=1817 RepID=UPI0013002EA1|nr:MULTISPECIES: hypothetical protein [Nocardia]